MEALVLLIIAATVHQAGLVTAAEQVQQYNTNDWLLQVHVVVFCYKMWTNAPHLTTTVTRIASTHPAALSVPVVTGMGCQLMATPALVCWLRTCSCLFNSFFCLVNNSFFCLILLCSYSIIIYTCSWLVFISVWSHYFQKLYPEQL